MARLLGPDPSTRRAWRFTAGRTVEGLQGKLLSVYTDEACTTLASIASYDPNTPATPGAVIDGSQVRVDQESEVPLFWFPDGVDELWAKTRDGHKLVLSADGSDIVADGGETPFGAQAKANAAQAAAISAASTDATSKANAAEAAAISAAAVDATTKSAAAQAAAITAAVQRANHTGTQPADTLTDGTTNKAFLATERAKLAGVATGATANATDAALRDRSLHTGTQAYTTVTGLGGAAVLNVGTASGTVAAGDAPAAAQANAATDATTKANAAQAAAIQRANHTGTQSADTLTDGTTNKAFLATERTKLTGLESATGAVTAKTSGYTLTTTDSLVTADATSAPFTITLPTAVGATGKTYTVKRVNSGSNAVTVATTSSQTIDGTTTYVLTMPRSSVKVASDGANWQVVGRRTVSTDVPSVKDFGALGNSVANDTAAFVAGLAATTGRTLYVPPGTYIVDPDAIVVGAGQRLVGESFANALIQSSAGMTGVGVTITGASAEVNNIWARGFTAGVDVRAWMVKVYECRFSYNEIGVDLSLNAYIVKIRGNEIIFNDVGVVVRDLALPYETNIVDNVIDNNNGVGIASYANSGGLVIQNNTIEGNRNYTTNVGCGLLIRGFNMSRLKVDGNWFENNGSNTTSAVDVLMLAGGTEPATGAALRAAIVAVLPTSLQSLFTTGGCGVGTVSFTNNAFIFTKYNLVLSAAACAVSVNGNCFKGSLNKYNKHIFLNIQAGSGGMGGGRVEIRNNGYRNSDFQAINAQVTTGIAGTIVHSDSVLTGTNDVYLHDGTNLFAGYSGEKTFPLQFATAANEKIDLYFTGDIYSRLEVTLVGYNQAANAAGTVTAIYSLAGTAAGTVYENSQTVLVAQGAIGTHFGLTAASWDATNSRWKITVAHRTTTANQVTAHVRWQTQSTAQHAAIRDSIAASAVYTTDATAVAAPAVTTVSPDVQTFTSSGTWTKPAGAVSVSVVLVSGGGGGGSGRRGAAGTVRSGGGGGGAQGASSHTYPASVLASTVAVSVGAGGAGGAAVATDNTDGNPGVNGNFSTFGTFLRAGTGATNRGGGGTATGATAGQGGYGNLSGSATSAGGGALANGGVGAAAATTHWCSGGGGGGGITAADSPSNGGAGGASPVVTTASAAAGGVVDTTAPGAGSNQAAGSGTPGTGGGGGAASITTAAQAGGAGGLYGAGGGGGGASLNGNNSGAGGAGANGIVVITTYF